MFPVRDLQAMNHPLRMIEVIQVRPGSAGQLKIETE
jgi:hypothetical protein